MEREEEEDRGRRWLPVFGQDSGEDEGEMC
ncbi:hypothetical protein CCACVL1_30123 [Corchorus capsularis]|uniref:Uncharacterized protein n=1 Tax=Corchorus capsularis TaxID=210143 RepID=A0A1R3FYN7_COCAP|nr:hypothetical protein CCACVL1_30123 [Corchorus capsularis]